MRGMRLWRNHHHQKLPVANENAGKTKNSLKTFAFSKNIPVSLILQGKPFLGTERLKGKVKN
jgi:hypothetical protein